MSSRKGSCSRWIAALVIALACLPFFAPTVEACMGCPCGIGPICIPCFPNIASSGEAIEITFFTTERAILRVPGYLTTHLEPGIECVVGLPSLPGLVSVNQVVNFDTKTDFPLAAVNFSSSTIPGPAVSNMVADLGMDVGNSLPWHTFVSTTEGSLDDGEPNHFVLELLLEPETDPYKFVEGLRSSGALLTASSDSEGIPDGGHLFLRPFGTFPIEIKLPGAPTSFDPRQDRVKD